MSQVMWDDMKSRRVVAFNQSTGNVLVKDGDKLVELEMYVGAGGGAQFRRPEPVPIDQLGERKKVPTAERWATSGIDQNG